MDIKEIRKIIRGVLREYRSAMGTTDGQLMQGELDWDHFTTPSGMFGPTTQAATEEFNDNINRELTLKPSFDHDTWSNKPVLNGGMFTEDDLDEVSSNANYVGKATPDEPTKAVSIGSESGMQDELMLQKNPTEK